MAEKEKFQTGDDGSEFVKLRIDHVKSPQFRVIHVNQVLGGTNQFGDLCMTVLNDRPGIPDSYDLHWHSDGRQVIVDPDVFEDGNLVAVREVEAVLMMSLPVANLVMNWIKAHLEAYARAERQLAGQPAESGE
ncbi:hypothetical protein [Fimbriimonas ginsengisoli]|uniref:hypothetical protein n=1 Tax=Fimbriimonas ginsengisoli TaxID=1005039 RepID=UPI00046D842C|nr:hypothetical protein [Fimbriimonas ginsengisoli]